MIQKLRKKFIIINMSFVTLVLAIVFTAFCYSNYRRYLSDSNDVLKRTLFENFDNLQPHLGKENGRQKPPSNIMPVFKVTLDENGSIKTINDSGVTADESLIQDAVSQVISSGKDHGLLRSLELRYMKIAAETETKIAFADCSHEFSSMRNLIFISVLVFMGSLGAFWGVSLFLSRWALTPVEAAWKQQRQFIADASHELKTPLTVILANLGILSAHPQDTIKDQKQWLENTQAEAGRMKKLLDNLLFLAKSDNAQPAVTYCDFDLSNAIWSCILPFESLVYEQKVTLNEEITPDIHMNGDEQQLKQLTAIFLDNACKYVKENGTITVRLALKGEKILFEIQNTGDIILPEDLEHIFERFYRSDKSRVRKEGGYGLGLSIAQTIVKNHHGKIKVVSVEEIGTTFTVTFPLQT